MSELTNDEILDIAATAWMKGIKQSPFDNRPALMAHRAVIAADRAKNGDPSAHCRIGGCVHRKAGFPAWDQRLGAIPDGWQLVPKVPTQEMVDCAKSTDGRLSVFKWADGYYAMLAAAPKSNEGAA